MNHSVIQTTEGYVNFTKGKSYKVVSFEWPFGDSKFVNPKLGELVFYCGSVKFKYFDREIPSTYIKVIIIDDNGNEQSVGDYYGFEVDKYYYRKQKISELL